MRFMNKVSNVLTVGILFLLLAGFNSGIGFAIVEQETALDCEACISYWYGKNCVCSCFEADLNDDYLVDYKDLAICGAKADKSTCEPCVSYWYEKSCEAEKDCGCSKADLNGDTLVDYKDLAKCGTQTSEKEAYQLFDGCLNWVCPTFYGAEFPQDCSPFLCNEKECINIVFDEATQKFREMLNTYYHDSFSSCVKVNVKGTAMSTECPINDSACVSVQFVKVISLSVAEPGCSELSWDVCKLNENKCWWSTCGCLPAGKLCDKKPCEDLTKDECSIGYYAGYCSWNENCKCIPIKETCPVQSDKPDLVAYKIEYKFSEDGKKIFFYVKIVNKGGKESGYFDVNIQIPQLSSSVNNYCGGKSLLPGEGCTETGYGYSSDGAVIKGLKLDIIAIADPRNNVDESNEDNNKLGITIYSGEVTSEIRITNMTIPVEEPVEFTKETCPVGCSCSDTEIKCETIPQQLKSECQTGCKLNDRCANQGTRVIIKEESSYCDIDGIWKIQKVTGEACQNNYECKTNFCSSDVCYDIKTEIEETKGILEMIVDFLKSLFGFGSS